MEFDRAGEKKNNDFGLLVVTTFSDAGKKKKMSSWVEVFADADLLSLGIL